MAWYKISYHKQSTHTDGLDTLFTIFQPTGQFQRGLFDGKRKIYPESVCYLHKNSSPHLLSVVHTLPRNPNKRERAKLQLLLSDQQPNGHINNRK